MQPAPPACSLTRRYGPSLSNDERRTRCAARPAELDQPAEADLSGNSARDQLSGWGRRSGGGRVASPGRSRRAGRRSRRAGRGRGCSRRRGGCAGGRACAVGRGGRASHRACCRRRRGDAGGRAHAPTQPPHRLLIQRRGPAQPVLLLVAGQRTLHFWAGHPVDRAVVEALCFQLLLRLPYLVLRDVARTRNRWCPPATACSPAERESSREAPSRGWSGRLPGLRRDWPGPEPPARSPGHSPVPRRRAAPWCSRSRSVRRPCR
jgi:hypothetical protein